MGNGMSLRRWMGVLACALAVFAASCASDGGLDVWRKGAQRPVALTADELSIQLDGFVDYVSATVQNVSSEMSKADDFGERRLAVVWKQRVVQSCRNAVLLPNAREGLVNVWTLCEQLHDFHTSERGRKRFGKLQPQVVRASELLLERIEQIADLVLFGEQFAKAQQDVRQFATAHPIGADLARAVTLPSDVPEEHAAALTWLLDIPLAPFGAFKGIDKGAEAIFEFSRTADRISRRAEGMPEQAIWELELLLLDTLNSPAMRQGRADFTDLSAGVSEIAESSSRFASTAETLPADVRTEIETAVENLKAHHVEFRETLAAAQSTVTETRAALDDARAVVKDVDALAPPVERTSRHLAEAGTAWEGAFKEFGVMIDGLSEDDGPPPPPDPNARPFDIRDYERTAKNLADTALELRQAIQELRGLVGEDLQGGKLSGVEEAAARTIDRAQESADVLTEGAFRRALVLLGAAFVLAVAFVWFSVRMRRGARGA